MNETTRGWRYRWRAAATVSEKGACGCPRGRASRFNNQHQYTGRYLDEPTGLIYVRHRHYEPRSGRFVSRDPAKYPWNNLYGYSDNGPTAGTDPTGLKKKSWWSKFKKKVGHFAKSLGHTVMGLLQGKGSAYNFVFQALLGWTHDDMQLDYQTLLDSEWDDGRGLWTIVWMATGYPRKKKNRKDNWIVQKITLREFTTNCDGQHFFNATGDDISPLAIDYLEAWSIKYVGFLALVRPAGDNWKDAPRDRGLQGQIERWGSAVWVGRNSEPGTWHHGAVVNAGDLRSKEIVSPNINDNWNPFRLAAHRSNAVERHRKKDWESCHSGD